ncbi:Uncharacterised protein [Mycobacterium tuberculosis]|nr:Uncharacterised protein [Mycobacterium tuberculosis]
MYQTATQPSNRYSGTPTERGAAGQHIFSKIPAIAPPQTIDNTTRPSWAGKASSANGV